MYWECWFLTNGRHRLDQIFDVSFDLCRTHHFVSNKRLGITVAYLRQRIWRKIPTRMWKREPEQDLPHLPCEFSVNIRQIPTGRRFSVEARHSTFTREFYRSQWHNRHRGLLWRDHPETRFAARAPSGVKQTEVTICISGSWTVSFWAHMRNWTLGCTLKTRTLFELFCPKESSRSGPGLIPRVWVQFKGSRSYSVGLSPGLVLQIWVWFQVPVLWVWLHGSEPCNTSKVPTVMHAQNHVFSSVMHQYDVRLPYPDIVYRQ